MTSDALRNLEAPRARGHQQPPKLGSCGSEIHQEHSAEAIKWFFRNISGCGNTSAMTNPPDATVPGSPQPCPSQARAKGQWPVHRSLGHASIATSPVFGASTISRWAWWLLAVHQPPPAPFDCRSNLPEIAWNNCPRCRAIGARHPVELMPVIAWNTQSWSHPPLSRRRRRGVACGL